MSRPRAVDYAALVGRWVDMERVATEEEKASGYLLETHGMRCLVEAVVDVPAGVLVVSDEGLSFPITATDEHSWWFTIRATPWPP